MPKHLPYRAVTASGNQFEFPLHPETASTVDVFNLLSAVLATLDHEIRQIGSVSDGDALQAVAMAVRTRILPGNPEALAGRLLADALAAPVRAAASNLAAGEPRDVH